MIYIIYKLVELVWVGEKFEPQVIYVGITTKGLNLRLTRHVDAAKKGTQGAISQKIRSIIRTGQIWRLKIFEIEITEDRNRESFWISNYRAKCETLTNDKSGYGTSSPICKNGHLFTDENTYTDSTGVRHCIDCKNASYRKRSKIRVDTTKVLVTRKECFVGHKLTPDNTYIAPNGKVCCRKCKRDRLRLHRARKRIKGQTK